MLAIHKTKENPLVSYTNNREITYNNLPKEAKDILNKNLLVEQGFICAYCMGRINENTMSIEHWYPRHPEGENVDLTMKEREENRRLGIDYRNMLAVCGGNEGQPPKNQHCDTLKGNRNIKFNPSHPEHYAKMKIKYSPSTGKITSDDLEFNEQIGGIEGNKGILNLNYVQIKNNRLAVLKQVRESLEKLPQNAPAHDIQKMLEGWQEPDASGKLQPYAGAAIFLLQRRLKVAKK